MKDTALNKIFKVGDRLIKGMWVAYGIHVTFLVLWLLKITPFWGWAVSIIPVFAIMLILIGTQICIELEIKARWAELDNMIKERQYDHHNF